MSNQGAVLKCTGGVAENARHKRGAARIPSRNDSFSPRPSAVRCNSEPSKPLIPAMRPFATTNSPAARPIIAPPASADHGVKAAISTSISMLPIYLRNCTCSILALCLQHRNQPIAPPHVPMDSQ